MIKKIIIIIIVALIMFLCFKINFNNKVNNNYNKSIIHSSKMNRSFFIQGYDDNKISKIQLSLNKRDNIYKIKDNKLYFRDRLIKDLFNVC
tara:strand:+ start:247 stop:519 length:273 start_codon:yes stop_codon:yes gene_type:complete